MNRFGLKMMRAWAEAGTRYMPFADVATPDLPLSKLSSEAPEYDRPWQPTPEAAPLAPVPQVDPVDALKALISDRQ